MTLRPLKYSLCKDFADKPVNVRVINSSKRLKVPIISISGRLWGFAKFIKLIPM